MFDVETQGFRIQLAAITELEAMAFAGGAVPRPSIGWRSFDWFFITVRRLGRIFVERAFFEEVFEALVGWESVVDPATCDAGLQAAYGDALYAIRKLEILTNCERNEAFSLEEAVFTLEAVDRFVTLSDRRVKEREQSYYTDLLYWAQAGDFSRIVAPLRGNARLNYLDEDEDVFEGGDDDF